MSIEVKLPEIGEGIESGDVLEVLVKEGQRIEKDQDIVELETDKATMGVPSSHAGKIVKVHVREGDSVPIGGTLITIEADGGEPAAKKAPAKQESPEPKKSPPKKAAEPEAAEPEAEADEQTVEEPAAKKESEKEKPPAKKSASKKSSDKKPKEATPAEEEAAAEEDEEDESAVEPAATPEVAASDGGEIAAGPAVRRFAREVGVDLRRVKGTGPGNRITRDDVLAVVRRSSKTAAGSKAAESEESDNWGPVRYERMSKIRKTIAAKMHESWSSAPRVTNFDDADVTDLEKFRQSSKDDYAQKGIKLTSMPFVLKAVAMALKTHPALNAAIDAENARIVYKQYVNVGIAVDSDRGLVVPSLRGVDKLSIPEIAQRLAALAENVRSGKFSPDDLRGSTFTISNLGAIGGTYSTPIINVPEVAILLLGRSRKMPVVINDQVTVRLLMPLSLSYDHRLVDGATAARFLNDVMSYLQAPSRLLLAP